MAKARKIGINVPELINKEKEIKTTYCIKMEYIENSLKMKDVLTVLLRESSMEKIKGMLKVVG